MKKLIILLILFITGCSTPSVKELNIAQTKTLLENNKDILIIDVRTQEEYDLGHIEGAILIPYDQLYSKLSELEEYKNKPILVYCRTQNRSKVAVDIFKNNGFKDLYQMVDGYSNYK